MMSCEAFPPGSYRYIPGVFQYSAGVVADTGYEIERARFREPLPLSTAWRVVEEHLRTVGRPNTAFCACELRSPEPFSEEGFVAFNRAYITTLERWGIVHNDINPVARTNVCPEFNPPAEPVMAAFSYTVPSSRGIVSFVVAGSGETREGAGPYRNSIVRFGETSPEAMRDKLVYVMSVMESRLGALGVTWEEATATRVYTVHDVFALLGPEIVARGAAPGGIEWHLSRPPVVHIEYEMDVRGSTREVVL